MSMSSNKSSCLIQGWRPLFKRNRFRLQKRSNRWVGESLANIFSIRFPFLEFYYYVNWLVVCDRKIIIIFVNESLFHYLRPSLVVDYVDIYYFLQSQKGKLVKVVLLSLSGHCHHWNIPKTGLRVGLTTSWWWHNHNNFLTSPRTEKGIKVTPYTITCIAPLLPFLIVHQGRSCHQMLIFFLPGSFIICHQGDPLS